jgi:hypothetical protein
MLIIEWRTDSKQEKHLDIACKNIEECVNVLSTLVTHHEYLKSEEYLDDLYYMYEVKHYNSLRGIYEPWKDPITGIDDPLEYWEYLENNLSL